MLSCNSLLCTTLYPCEYINYFGHNIFTMESSNPIISSFVELFPFIFYLVYNIVISTLTRDIIAPMCIHQSSCTAYEVPNHHLTTYITPTLKLSFIPYVTFSDFSTYLSFYQYYSSILFTLAARNSTNVCMYWCDQMIMNSSCATVWCEVCNYY